MELPRNVTRHVKALSPRPVGSRDSLIKHPAAEFLVPINKTSFLTTMRKTQVQKGPWLPAQPLRTKDLMRLSEPDVKHQNDSPPQDVLWHRGTQLNVQEMRRMCGKSAFLPVPDVVFTVAAFVGWDHTAADCSIEARKRRFQEGAVLPSFCGQAFMRPLSSVHGCVRLEQDLQHNSQSMEVLSSESVHLKLPHEVQAPNVLHGSHVLSCYVVNIRVESCGYMRRLSQHEFTAEVDRQQPVRLSCVNLVGLMGRSFMFRHFGRCTL